MPLFDHLISQFLEKSVIQIYIFLQVLSKIRPSKNFTLELIELIVVRDYIRTVFLKDHLVVKSGLIPYCVLLVETYSLVKSLVYQIREILAVQIARSDVICRIMRVSSEHVASQELSGSIYRYRRSGILE